MREKHMNDFQPRNFDLNLLRVFDALWETRSVTGAANKLCVTPSGVSHALNKLRQLLRDELFVRGARSMQPTPFAVDIGPKVQAALLDLMSALSPSDFEPAQTTRQFVIAATPYTSWALLPVLLPRFKSLAPKATLRFQRSGSNVLDILDARGVDLAIGMFDVVPAQFGSAPLFTDELVWLMRKDHPHRDQHITCEFLANAGHIHVMLSSDTDPDIDAPTLIRPESMVQPGALNDKGFLDTVLAKKGLSRSIEISVPDTLTALSATATSDHGMMSPRKLARSVAQFYGLQIYEMPYEAPPLEFHAVWRDNPDGDPAIDWLRNLLCDASSDI